MSIFYDRRENQIMAKAKEEMEEALKKRSKEERIKRLYATNKPIKESLGRLG